LGMISVKEGDNYIVSIAERKIASDKI
jgi:hypothetical protein